MALVLVSLLLAGLAPAAAQDVESLPGFVDFESFGDFDLDDLQVEINLGGGLLKMLSGAVEDDDGDFGELLRGLSLIKVNISKRAVQLLRRRVFAPLSET